MTEEMQPDRDANVEIFARSARYLEDRTALLAAESRKSMMTALLIALSVSTATPFLKDKMNMQGLAPVMAVIAWCGFSCLRVLNKIESRDIARRLEDNSELEWLYAFLHKHPDILLQCREVLQECPAVRSGFDTLTLNEIDRSNTES